MSSFHTTLYALERSGGSPERYSSCFLDVLPVTGAAVSTLGDVMGSETVSATDVLAARLDEIQFDLGEGPGWDAVRTAIPVTEPDFPVHGPRRWRNFAEGVPPAAIASIFAFPLTVGALRLGAVDLYTRHPLTLDERQSEQASAMADVVGRHLLREAVADGGVDDGDGGPYSRRIVHQATGIVLAQLGIGADDAELMIRAHAFSAGTSMMRVSKDITEGGLRFTRIGGRIEAQS